MTTLRFHILDAVAPRSFDNKIQGRTNILQNIRKSVVKLASLGLLLLASVSASAAVEFESVASANAYSSSSLTINKPSGLQVNDLMLAFIGSRRTNSSPVVGGPAGWTKLFQEDSDGTAELTVLWKVAVASDVSAPNFTFTNQDREEINGAILRYSGASTTAPIDVYQTATSSSGSNASVPSATTTVSNTRVIRAIAWQTNNNIGEPSTSRFSDYFANNNDWTGINLAVSDAAQAAAGSTGTSLFTGGDSGRDRVTATIAIKPPQLPVVTTNLISLTGGTIVPPTTADYRLTITKESVNSISALGVVSSNTLPTGFTYRSSSVSTSGTCSRSPTSNPSLGQSTLSWGTWNMAENCVVTINYTVDINRSAQMGIVSDDVSVSGSNFVTIFDDGSSTDEDVTIGCSLDNISNTATVSSDGFDSTPADNSSTACTQKLENSGFVGGTVWLDEDQDGINDIEEARLTNVLVELRDGVCTPASDCATALTDQFGNYTFSQLPPGNYDVYVTPSTLPTDVTNTAGPYGQALRSVTLTDGQEIVGQDFGYIANPDTGIIGDRVWSDADGDGVQDLGEAGLAGVTLTLRDSAGSVVATTTSNADGDYLFTDIPFGTHYTVTVTNNAALTGFSPTSGLQSEGSYVSSPITLNKALTTVTDADFGFISASTLTFTDRVWFDADANGAQNGGEIGIAGVTVELLNSVGQVVATTTTNVDGDFTFTGIPDASNYSIKVSDHNNALEQMVETTSTGGTQVVTGLLSTAAAVNADTSVLNTVGDDGTATFGYNRPGTIAGTVWSDAVGPTGASALQDNGEPGIEGVVVTITPPAFIDLGAGAGVAITRVTGPDGRYQFDDLPPADYTVQILLADRPTHNTHTKDPDNNQNHSVVISMPLGQSITGQDFGYRNNALNPISGTVFLDRDKDGVEEPNGNDGVFGNGDDEPGFEGVSLDLKATYQVINGAIDIDGNGVINASDDGVYDGYQVIDGLVDFNGDGATNGSDDGFIRGVFIVNGGFDVNGDNAVNASDAGRVLGDTIATTTSDSDGEYTFSGVANGDYVVQVTDNDGVVAGYDITSGLDWLDVNVSGAAVADIDFGYIKDEETGSISGEVFIDEATINGVADDKETNLSGVEIYLCNSPVALGSCDPTDPEYIKTAITDARGDYIFAELPSGNYVVDADTGTISGGGTLPDDLSLTVDPVVVAVAEGEDVQDVDIGYEADDNTGVLSGFVWTDFDGDGTYDAGEAPIGGVTIQVLGPYEVVVATATTKADGSWIVTGISGADLQDELTVAYVTSDIPVALENSQPTNMALGTDRYFPVNLSSDPDNYVGDLDFGFQPTVSATLGDIVGTIYSDADANTSYLATMDGEFQAVTLNLIDCGLDGCGNANDVVIATTSTDQEGIYRFTGIPDGEYRVVLSDNSNVLRDVNPLEALPTSILINAIDGRTKTNVNAGFVSNTLFGSVGNRFWLDVDNDGFVDVGEPGIEGITIQCWADNDRSETPNNPNIASASVTPQPGVDNLIRTVVTNANGEYYCTSLPTGQYIVRVFDSLGFTEGDDGTHVTGNVGDHYAKPWSYVLTTASPNLTADFGVNGSNSVAGKVFIEAEGLVEPDLNGTVDAGELDGSTTPTGGTNGLDVSADTPAGSVTVALYIKQPNGSFSYVRNTATDANGDYSFTGLPDGDYKIVVQPTGSMIDGFGQTGDPDLVANALGHGDEDLVCDSPTSSLCDNATVQSLSGGTPVAGVDFGYQKNFVTTPVTLTMFKAESTRGGVLFTWESMNEVAHFGYQIYALVNDDWVLLTDSPIVSEGSDDALATKRYEFFYTGETQQWFTLVDVSTVEVLTKHGPYRLDEIYGAEAVPMQAYDWSQVESPTPTTSNYEVKSQLQQKIDRLKAQDSEPEVLKALSGDEGSHE